MANDGPPGYSELHSRKDNEYEERNQKIFSRVVLYSGIALLVIFLVALLVVQHIGRHMKPVHPDNHPTSQLIVEQPTQWVA